jgi:pimeloyl-ACP methyl ester carboxylesterase
MLGYEIRGEGGPVVLLHGGALNGRMWDGQLGGSASR